MAAVLCCAVLQCNLDDKDSAADAAPKHEATL